MSSTRECLHIIRGYKSYMFNLAVLPNGRLVSGSNDSEVREITIEESHTRARWIYKGVVWIWPLCQIATL